MTKYSLCLVLILSFSNAVAVAQPIYGWKDEKDQWHFSNVVPAGISAKKMLDGISTPESLPATPQTEPNPSPTAASNNQEKAASKLPITDPSEISPARSDPRWLLIFPSRGQAKTDNSSRFSGWRPVQFFDSDEACFRYKAALLSGGSGWPSSLRGLNSNCIPASEFSTGKEADVSVTHIQFEPVAVGFSGHLLSGRVFNRGQDIARNVVAKYQIRDRNGVVIAKGEASTVLATYLESPLENFAHPVLADGA